MVKKILVSMTPTQKEQLIMLSKFEEKTMTHIMQDGFRMYVAQAKKVYKDLVLPGITPMTLVEKDGL